MFHWRHQRLVLPVYADVWYRLVLRIRPVNARFSFLDRQNPDAVCCPQVHCYAAETYAHLFLECPDAWMLWNSLWTGWSRTIRGQLSWAALIANPVLAENPEPPLARAITDLWHIMRTVIVRHLWMNRNRIVFQGAEPQDHLSIRYEVLGCFAAHVRRLRRIFDSEVNKCYDQVLNQLLRDPVYRDFFSSRRHLLQCRIKLFGATV